MCNCGAAKYRPATPAVLSSVQPGARVIGVETPTPSPETIPVTPDTSVGVQRTTGYKLPPNGGAANNDPVPRS